MNHPLAFLPPNRRTVVFLALLADTLLLTVVMGIVGQPLYTEAAPNGIVSFELAFSVPQARLILDSWDNPTLVRAAFIQGLDFLYLLVYAAAFALASLLAAGVLQRQGWPLARLGKPVAWGFGAAAGFDFCENVALVLLLLGFVSSPWPQIAAVCAWIKFGLLFLGMVYIFYAAALRLADRLMHPAA